MTGLLAVSRNHIEAQVQIRFKPSLKLDSGILFVLSVAIESKHIDAMELLKIYHQPRWETFAQWQITLFHDQQTRGVATE